MTEKTHKHRDKIPFGKNMSRLVPSWEGVRQGCILSPCLFNLHVEYIMRNAGLDESQAGRNINVFQLYSYIYIYIYFFFFF